jgi:hypothetical protein
MLRHPPDARAIAWFVLCGERPRPSGKEPFADYEQILRSPTFVAESVTLTRPFARIGYGRIHHFAIQSANIKDTPSRKYKFQK